MRQPLQPRRGAGWQPADLRERSRDVKLLGWLDALFKDVRFGLHMLRKDVVVASAAVLSLSLAMGACIAAFGLIDALILRPLPVHDPHRLVVLTYPRNFEALRVTAESSSPPLHVSARIRRAING